MPYGWEFGNQDSGFFWFQKCVLFFQNRVKHSGLTFQHPASLRTFSLVPGLSMAQLNCRAAIREAEEPARQRSSLSAGISLSLSFNFQLVNFVILSVAFPTFVLIQFHSFYFLLPLNRVISSSLT